MTDLTENLGREARRLSSGGEIKADQRGRLIRLLQEAKHEIERLGLELEGVAEREMKPRIY